MLSTGVDTLVGTSGADVVPGSATTFNPGDKIDGGSGTDELLLTDVTTAPSAHLIVDGKSNTMASVELITIVTAGGIQIDTTTWTDAADLDITATGTAGVTASAAGTTAIAVETATTGAVSIEGGSDVTVIASSAAAGTVKIAGRTLASAGVSGGADITIDNQGATGLSGQGTTLTSVNIDGATGNVIALSGAALTGINLSNIDHAASVQLNNASAGHALNLSLNAVGYGTDGTERAPEVRDDEAISAMIDTGLKSALHLAGAKLATVTLTGAGDLHLKAGAALTTVDGASATGALTLDILPAAASVSTGSGADRVALTTATTKNSVNATLDTGAGNDVIVVQATGTGNVSVRAGAGNDTLTLASRASGTLSIELGAGDDVLASSHLLLAGDSVNSGAGTDTLPLMLVNATNAGIFAGFEVMDASNLNRTIDLGLLAASNAISEVVASGAVGAAALDNMGAGVGYRARGDMGDSVLTISQKVAGAVTITADIDETGTPDREIETAAASVVLANATSANIVFGSDFLAPLGNEQYAAGDNFMTLNVEARAAGSASVVSGGAFATNILNYNDSANQLTSLSLSGDKRLTLNLTSTSLSTIDASALSADFVASTSSLANGGKMTLGSGIGAITVAASSTVDGRESIMGIKKAGILALSQYNMTEAIFAMTSTNADMLILAGAKVATATAVEGGVVNSRGLLTFTATGPASLADAFQVANLAAETAGELLVFEYGSDSYLFMQGTTDRALTLAGTTGLSGIGGRLGVTNNFHVAGSIGLTAGVDAIIGTAAADLYTGTAATLAAGDAIDGGDGTDAVSLLDLTAPSNAQSTFSGITMRSVEYLDVTTSGGLALDALSYIGLKGVDIAAYGSGAVNVAVPDNVRVKLTSGSDQAITVSGGTQHVLNASNAAAGDVAISGKTLLNVDISGGRNVTVDNLGNAGESGLGKTIYAVRISGATGPSIAIKGGNITSIDLTNIFNASAATLTNATAGHWLSLKLDAVGYDTSKAQVAVSVADPVATKAFVSTVSKSAITLTGLNLTSVSLSGAGDLTLDVNSAANGNLKQVFGSGESGNLTLTGTGAALSLITTGKGDDSFTLATATVDEDLSTLVKESVFASGSAGSGNDRITLATTGDGYVYAKGEDGNDTVHLASRSGRERLMVDLGAGQDGFTVAVGQMVTATDSINGGAGTDTIRLDVIGSANAGAFAGFERFDAADLNKTFDLGLLAARNMVTEIFASADTGAATLHNLGAGTGFRAVANMGGSELTLVQQVAGAITITADMDETGPGDDAIDEASSSLIVANALSANIVFSSDFLAQRQGESAVGDNAVWLTVTAPKAASASVVSGGTLAANHLLYKDSGNVLNSLKVSGDQPLFLGVSTAALATVDASQHTGGLHMTTGSLANHGTVILGSGADEIKISPASIVGAHERISGFERTSAAAVGADAPAAAAAIAAADKLLLDGATVANASIVSGGAVDAKGILTFTGAGPALLADAFAIAQLAAETDGETLLFTYLNDSYVFVQGADIVVELTGVSGLTHLVDNGSGAFFLV